jgi:N-formylglutamate deformylase
MAPTGDEVQARLQRYWRPYHDQLRAELDRLLARHGRVVLWDAHSIASRVPRFFEGRLPDLNFGTAEGRSCAPGLEQAVVGVAREQARFSIAVNGRFKGGHITRHYGQPESNVHAIQLEMCQCLYMDEAPPFAWRPDVAGQVQPLLRDMLQAALEWVRA